MVFNFLKQQTSPEVAEVLAESKRRGKEQAILRGIIEKKKKEKELKELEESKLARLKGKILGRRVREFSKVGLRRPDFTTEQVALQQMFGHGDHIWGLGEDSGTRVTIHNDLNPRQRGDNSTAELFGFG